MKSSSVGSISAKMYRSLFSTPSPYISAAYVLGLYMVLAPILLGTILNAPPLTVALEFSLPTLLSTWLGFTLTCWNTPMLKRNVLRRIVSYPLYAGLFIFPAAIMLALARSVMTIHLPLYLSATPSSSLLYMISRSTTERSPYRSLLYSLSSPLIISIYALSTSNFNASLLAAVLGGIAAGMAEAYFYTIKCSGVKLGISNPVDMFRGFAEEWLADSSSRLERELVKMSTEEEGSVKTLEFTDDGDRYALVQTTYHTGPIRGVGGADLPATVSRELNRRGVRAVLLHAPSDHRLDPVSSTDKMKVLRGVIKCVEGGKHRAILVGAPFTVEGRSWVLHVYPYRPAPLVFVYSKSGGIDDLPPELNSVAEDVATRLGLADCILVESHNSIGQRRALDKSDVEEIKKLLERGLGRISKFKRGVNYKVGMVKVDKSGIGQECSDICSDGVTVLSLEVDGKKYGIVVVDGNNMKEDFRGMIEEAAEALGYEFVTIATTDSHELTGRLTGTSGYHPVGSKCPDRLLSVIKHALNLSSQAMKEMASFYAKNSGVRVRVLGEKGLEMIGKLLEGPGRYASKTLVPALLLVHIASLAVAVLFTVVVGSAS